MSSEERGAEGKDTGTKRYVIFCVDGSKYGQPGYAFFMHEADVIMAAVAVEVRSRKLTPVEGRESLEPYREVLPPLYTGEQRMVFDPNRDNWDDPDSFPRTEAVLASPQASQIFWYEVDELGIEGVTLVWSVPFPVLAPVSEQALEELREAVANEYEIVVKDTLDEFDATGKSVEWARKLIEDATKVQDRAESRTSQESMVIPGTILVYGNSGEGLVFLKADYAADIRDFRGALYRAATWGDLKDMVSEERYRRTIEAWTESERDRLLDEAEDNEEPEVAIPELDDAFDAESIAGYSDGDWPEFAPNMMGTWVDREIISEYGWYVETILNGYYPVIDPGSEEEVVSWLEEQGYVCTQDDDIVWDAIWGG